MHPLLFLAGVVVPDEALGQGFIQDIVSHSVENDLVDEGGRLHEPFLRLEDREHFKLAGLILLRTEDVGQLLGADQHIGLILRRPGLFPLPFPCFEVCVVQNFERTHFDEGQTSVITFLPPAEVQGKLPAGSQA